MKKKKLLTLLLKGDGKMIKKMLVVMLVLGMASAANAIVAQLSFNGATDGANGDTVGTNNTYMIDVSTDFVIGVVSDTDDPGGSYERLVRVYDVGFPFVPVTDVSGFTIANGNIYGVSHGGVHADGGDAGDNALFTASTVPNTIQITALDTDDPFVVGAGTQFDWVLHYVSNSDVYIDLTDESLVVLDRILVQEIPEPATIALLGLGGLFLRRRRKSK